MVSESVVEDSLPLLDEIESETLKNKVIKAWTLALSEGSYDTLDEIPWWPPYKEAVGEKYLVDHLKNDATFAKVIANTLTEHIENIEIDKDVVVAGALLHDISKLFETNHDGLTELGELIPHPHYSVYVLGTANLPLHVQHIVLGHTPRSNIDLVTIEGQIVQIADELGGKGWFWAEANRLDPGVYGSDR